MALSLLATVNAMVTIGPRVYYAMAQEWGLFCRGRQSSSALAYAGDRDRLPGRLHAY